MESTVGKQKSTASGRLEMVLRKILLVGIAISLLFLVFGILLLFQNPVRELSALPPGQILDALWQLRPAGFINLGLLSLLATPLAGVVGVIVGFVADRDWRFAGVSVTVLLILLLSISVGLH